MKLRFAWLLLLGLLLAGCSVDLQHDLSEQDANDIYVLLNANGISCQKTLVEGGNVPTYTISVAKSDAAQAAKLLRENSLPRPHLDGLSIFAKNKGMIPTEVEQRAMFLQALGGEVSNALDRVDGVLEAKAIVMIPQQNELTQPENAPKPSASVFVKYRPDVEGKPPLGEDQIRAFVADAVPNLTAKNVTVLLSAAQPPSQDVNPDSRMVDVVGIRMTASSVGRFKLMMVGAAALVLLLIAFTGWTVLKGSAGRQGAPQPRPMRPRVRPPEA